MQTFAAGIVGTFLLWAMWSTAQVGYSRSVAETSSETRQLSLAGRAVDLSPADPETHFHRAEVLWAVADKKVAIAEAERAVVLRPRDYFLWLRLGYYLYFAGDADGALHSFTEAARRAPYYAEPHFYIGSILLQQGRRDEGFAEFRRAIASDNQRIRDVISIAGETFGDDTESIVRAIRPQSRSSRLALSQYFVEKGKADEAMKLFNESAGYSEQDRQKFLQQLLTAKRFSEAFELWTALHKDASPGQLTDPGFEGRNNFKDPGFGWQQQRDLPGVQISVDTSAPRSGTQSILVTFKGVAKPGAPVLTQLVRVDPNVPYSVGFAVRTQDVVSGGLPVVAVLDANDQKILAETDPLEQTAAGEEWQEHRLDFATGSTTSAIIIALRRRNCSSSPCPIFGRLWLDDFSMKRTD